MNMGFLDWTIVLTMMAVVTAMVLYTRRYTNSVADFLAAGRSAGRYMLCISDGMAALGAITIVMMFEMYYRAGFPVIWWQVFQMMIIPTLLSLAGFIIYRFRQTRALTLAQFFEMRYSKNLRIFAGFLIWFSGILNFGIFPAVGARFFMVYMGFSDSIWVYAAIMLILLSISLFYTFSGGQVAVMVADFLQGVFCNVMFVVILIAVFFMFDWSQIIETLSQAPEGASMIHPFQVDQAQDFNIFFYLILAFTATYGFLAWQGTSGYNASARNAHEARMGKSLSFMRMLIQLCFVLVIPVCAYTFMHHPAFLEQSAQARGVISAIEDQTIAHQVTTSIVLSHILPVGLMGGFLAVMLAAFISTHNTYLHSWGSIFIQDFILPLKKKNLTPKQHIAWLRISIFGVAAFVFLFSLVFRQTEYIIMYFQITGAIWIGGAGAVIIGGLYWKHGTTMGAWAGLITGSLMSTSAIILQQMHQQFVPFNHPVLAYVASRSGAVLGFWASVGAITSYVLVSLLDRTEICDMDKLLHRGRYAVNDDNTKVSTEPIAKWRKIIGLNSDFNLKDKIIYLAVFGWVLGLLAMFVGVTAYSFIFGTSTQWWISFWRAAVWVLMILGTAVTVVLAVGGFVDMKKMFARLKSQAVDKTDDGRVDAEDRTVKDVKKSELFAADILAKSPAEEIEK